MRSIGQFYLAIINCTESEIQSVVQETEKSDSYIGCRRKNMKDHSVRKTLVKKLTGLEFLSSFFQFVHSAEPYSGSSLPNSSLALSWLSGDDK